MTFTRIPGGLWVPKLWPGYNYSANSFPQDVHSSALMDADEEEYQYIGHVYLAAGGGSKTFGTSGSAIGWNTYTPITFAGDSPNNPTFTVGVKKAASIDLTSGPPARATIGAAAFDVYKSLVGGTDTIATNTWYNTSMASGTPFTVNHGDMIAICFHLDKPGAAAQAVRLMAGIAQMESFPASTAYTSGTYSNAQIAPNAILTFDDGTIGWINGSWIRANTAGGFESIGDTNIYGNVFRLPFDAKVDAVGAMLVPSGTTNFDIGLWQTPTGTPTAMTSGTVSLDPQLCNNRWHEVLLPAEIQLTANTDYFVAIKQNSATGITVLHQDVNSADHLQAIGLDSTCYAAKSTAGAAVVAQNSGKRRCGHYVRLSQIDIPAGGGGLRMAGVGGLATRG